MRERSLRIGFDVAQTCHDRAGRGWVADLLVKELVKLGPHHRFFLYHQFGNWINKDTAKGTHLGGENVSEPFRLLSPEEARKIWQSVGVGTKILPGAPDIVHANCFQAPAVAPAKLVYTIYDVSFWVCPEFTTEENRLVCQRGVLEAIGRAAAFVFISQSSLGEFERETILDAFQIYFDQSPTKRRLAIAGGRGWKSDDIHARINDLERRGLVKYEGYVEDSRLQELYSNAFGLVFLSHYEGFGLPIVEAMSQACPVITRRNSSLPEVGGSAAIYCDNDSVEIANAMLRLERDEPYYLATSHASWTHAKRFSWSAAAEKVLDLYHQLVTE